MDFMTQDEQEVALTLMEGLDSAQSLSVAIMLRSKEWDQITRHVTEPRHYIDATTYLRNAAATSFLRKLDADVGNSEMLEAATLKKWLWAEQQCFKTNQRLNQFLDCGPFYGPTCEPWLIEFLDSLRKNVELLIGQAPPSIFDGKFGPGATVSDSSLQTTVCHKMSSTPTFTPNAVFHLVPWTGTKWAVAYALNSEKLPCMVRGNTYFTAPKDSTARRPCGKEPSINGFYQLGLGRVMRERLKRQGIDLDNGQSVHRQVACIASLRGSDGSGTLDLTSASDCEAYALVRLALPPKWFDVLDQLRSPMTEVNGKWFRLEKFSSMGNGFTFELETVLFTAIAMTVMNKGKPCERVPCELTVYGDDIICPSSEFENIVSALKYFGFTPNLSKSFNDGYFRESCGGDFFNGVAVRPYFMKELLHEPQQIISAANGIRRMALQNGHPPDLWHDLRRTWFKLLDLLPVSIRSCRGPEGLGDLVIHDDESRWNARWRSSGIRYLKCYRPARYRGVKFERFSPEVQIAAALYGVSLRQLGRVTDPARDQRSLIPRDGVIGYKVGWVPFS